MEFYQHKLMFLSIIQRKREYILERLNERRLIENLSVVMKIICIIFYDLSLDRQEEEERTKILPLKSTPHGKINTLIDLQHLGK